MRIRISREVEIPDRLKIERYRRMPELGPRILFFSGGTALKAASRSLTEYTHNSIHLITPFDSGGSSAVLRKAYNMPAVGDIRNRMMAMADQSVQGNPEIYDLFAYRLPKDISQDELRAELEQMAKGKHQLIVRVPDPMRKIIRNSFHKFLKHLSPDFDLRGASIGNIVLTAGYLSNRRQMDPVIYIFSKLVQVCGTVRPILNKDLQLAVRLKDGSVVQGQHAITGKEKTPLASPIETMWLTETQHDPTPVEPTIRNKIKELILKAELICYPIGSFYSSVLANLLPKGVGKAVAKNRCPKVFVPNLGKDPEASGLSVADQVEILLRYLSKDGVPKGCSVLDLVVIDSKRGKYQGPVDIERIQKLGIQVADCHLVTDESAPLIDADLFNKTLLSLT